MIAYLDTSAWIAWKFAQKGQEILKRLTFERDTVVSSPLLASEYVSFLKRSELLDQTRFEDELAFIEWIYPADPLFAQSLRCVQKQNLRGADLHHLSTALWFAEDSPEELHFFTCDAQQEKAARVLGMKT